MERQSVRHVSNSSHKLDMIEPHNLAKIRIGNTPKSIKLVGSHMGYEHDI